VLFAPLIYSMQCEPGTHVQNASVVSQFRGTQNRLRTFVPANKIISVNAITSIIAMHDNIIAITLYNSKYTLLPSPFQVLQTSFHL